MKLFILFLVVGIIFYCSENNVFKKLKQRGGVGGDADNTNNMPMIIAGVTALLALGVGLYMMLSGDECKDFTCPANSERKNKKSPCKGKCTVKECCDCNTDYKRYKNTCVPKKCSEFSCKNGFKLKSDPDKIPCDDKKGCDETKCCDKSNTSTTCDKFECKSGYKKKSGAAKTKCDDDADCKAKCCETDTTTNTGPPPSKCTIDKTHLNTFFEKNSVGVKKNIDSFKEALLEVIEGGAILPDDMNVEMRKEVNNAGYSKVLKCNNGQAIIVDNKCDKNGHFKLCCEKSPGSKTC